MRFKGTTVVIAGGSSDIDRGAVGLLLHESVQVIMGTQESWKHEIPKLFDTLLPASIR